MEESKLCTVAQLFLTIMVIHTGGANADSTGTNRLNLRVTGCDSLTALLEWDRPDWIPPWNRTDTSTWIYYHVAVLVYDNKGEAGGKIINDKFMRTGARHEWISLTEKYRKGDMRPGIQCCRDEVEPWGQHPADFVFKVRPEFSDEYDEVRCSTFSPAPQNVRPGICGANAVELIWDHPDNVTVGYYVLERVPYVPPRSVAQPQQVFYEIESNYIRDSVHGSKTSGMAPTVTGSYFFYSVYAVTNNTRSRSVGHVPCRPIAKPPARNPDYACALKGGRNQLTIRWTSVYYTYHNGPGFHYLVSYYPFNSTSSDGKFHPRDLDKFLQARTASSKGGLDQPDNHMVIDGLEYDDPYMVTVQAVNDIGQAPVDDLKAKKMHVGKEGCEIVPNEEW